MDMDNYIYIIIYIYVYTHVLIYCLFIYLFEGDYSISQHSYEKWMKVPMKKLIGL